MGLEGAVEPGEGQLSISNFQLLCASKLKSDEHFSQSSPIAGLIWTWEQRSFEAGGMQHLDETYIRTTAIVGLLASGSVADEILHQAPLQQATLATEAIHIKAFL